MKNELLKGLTKAQIAKVESCKNNEELLSLAKEEGVELTEEQLNAINGRCGGTTKKLKCPKCGSRNTKAITPQVDVAIIRSRCFDCGYIFKIED